MEPPGGKERLGFLEKTQAQKRHLLNVFTAKSKLETRQPHPIQHRCFSPLSITQRQLQNQNNHNLGRKLITISNMPHSPRGLKLSRNLQLNSSVNRMSKMREIQVENNKLFSRLVTTPSTLKRSAWSKSSLQAEKYEENLHRSRYLQPDYSIEARKMIKSSAKFKCLLITCSARREKQD